MDAYRTRIATNLRNHAAQLAEILQDRPRWRRTLRAVVVSPELIGENVVAFRIVYAPGMIWARRIHYHPKANRAVAAFDFDGQTTMEEVCIALGLHNLSERVNWTVEDAPGVQEFAAPEE